MNIRNKRAKMIFRVDLAYIIKWSAVKIFIEVLLHYSCFWSAKLLVRWCYIKPIISVYWTLILLNLILKPKMFFDKVNPCNPFRNLFNLLLKIYPLYSQLNLYSYYIHFFLKNGKNHGWVDVVYLNILVPDNSLQPATHYHHSGFRIHDCLSDIE